MDREREEYVREVVDHRVFIEAKQRESGTAFTRGTLLTGVGDNFGNGLSNFFPQYTFPASEGL